MKTYYLVHISYTNNPAVDVFKTDTESQAVEIVNNYAAACGDRMEWGGFIKVEEPDNDK